MKLRILRSFALTIIAIVSPQNASSLSGSTSLFQKPPQRYTLVSHETHERVLDIVFQRDEGKRDYDFILRFEPNFAPESQIVVKRVGAKAQIVEYTSLSGSIYTKLNSMKANGGKEDAVEMAKLIQVQKRVLEIPTAQVRQWRRSLPDSIDATMKTLEQRDIEDERGNGTITLDGTFYYFWYTQVTGDISFNLLDYEISDRKITGELGLVRWMNAVRLDIRKLKLARRNDQ